MSRNRSRTQVPEQKEPNNIPNTSHPAERPNPFGLSFVVPTEIVHLPSGGVLYDESSPLKDVDFVEIKAMTAKEEDIMINDNFIQTGIVFDKLIDSLMVTPGIKSTDLLDCDKIAVLVAARKTGYGDELYVNHTCPSCQATSEVTLSLTKMLEKAKEEKFEIQTTDEWTFDAVSKTLNFVLPQTKLNTSIKIMSQGDYKYLEDTKKKKEKLNLPYNDTLEFIRRVIVSVNDVVDHNQISSLLEVLPAADARKIKYIHNINVPGFDTKQEVECPECSTVVEKEVPFSAGWFWSI